MKKKISQLHLIGFKCLKRVRKDIFFVEKNISPFLEIYVSILTQLGQWCNNEAKPEPLDGDNEKMLLS